MIKDKGSQTPEDYREHFSKLERVCQDYLAAITQDDFQKALYAVAALNYISEEVMALQAEELSGREV